MRPVAPTERVVSIDTMRGAALGGVLLVNLLTGFRAPLSAHILGQNKPLGPAGSLLLALVAALIEFKAFTLFSFLFGVGVAIQAGRAGAQHRFQFFLRRFGALLAIGLVHLLLIWNGDILALYAVCGLLLLPLLWLPEVALAFLGLLLIAAPYVALLPVSFPHSATLRELTVGALHTYRTGTWRELFAFRWRETKLLILPLLALSLPRTLGLMLWGIAAWRCGLVENNQRLWRWVVTLGAAIGLPGLWLGGGELATIPLAFAYAAAILLWMPHSRLIAAGGRMALTNYLTQSIIFGFIFYSYGLGCFGRVGVGATLAGGIALYASQLVCSRWWLKRFYFGPVEWLWRSVSYLEWQPFLREEARTVSREQARVLLLVTLVILVPLFHLGGPLLLARVGPHWGWNGKYLILVNLSGAIPILAGGLLLAWILMTMLVVLRGFPARVRLGLRPSQLVQTGPYAWMRHPMYVAESCLWLGMAVLLGSPVVAGVFACLAFAGSHWMIPREERALEEQFGEEYRAYRRRVSAIPRFRVEH